MPKQSTRRFPPPWTVEQTPGGYKVKDANGQALAYVYGRETRAEAYSGNEANDNGPENAEHVLIPLKKNAPPSGEAKSMWD